MDEDFVMGVELFTTSSGHNAKTKKDCYRLRSLLDVKKIDYTEVSFLSLVPHPRHCIRHT